MTMQVNAVKTTRYNAHSGSSFLGQYNSHCEAVSRVVVHEIGCKKDRTEIELIQSLLSYPNVLKFMLENSDANR